MQTTGEQDYWKTPEPANETAPQPPVSQYAGYDLQQSQVAPVQPQEFPEIHWEASEYVHSEKGFLWFLALGVVTLTIAAIAYFLIKSWSFMLLVFVMAAVTGIYARRPPRSLQYSLEKTGLAIEEREYKYSQFKAFSVMKDGPMPYIMLIPVKRFMPAVTLYFPPEEGERIVDLLGSLMPMEQRELDPIDKLVRKLRF